MNGRCDDVARRRNLDYLRHDGTSDLELDA